ncbi:MAG TPA: hypothetical protein VID47_08220 [Actinomycetota bacterium]
MAPRRAVLVFPIAIAVVVASALPALASAGDLDPTFGHDGKVRVSSTDGASDVAIQPDGKTVAVGASHGHITVMRFDRDGTLDHTFSGDGVAHLTTGQGRTDFANAVAIHLGKIVVVGTSVRQSDSGFATAILRLDSDGTLDHSFSGDGRQLLRVGSESTGEDVAIQGDGRIVVAGTSDGEFLVVRRLANGAPDPSFSNDGSDRTAFVQEAEARTVGIDPTNGRIVVGGTFDSGTGPHDLVLAAYTKSGDLDHTFSQDGKMIRVTSTRGGLAAIAILASGRILVAGTTRSGQAKGQFLVEKYTRTGAFDTSFGGGDGIVPIGFVTGGHPRDDLASGIATQSDGRIVVAGMSAGQTDEFAVARLNANGALDNGFHGGGVLTAFPEDAEPTGIAVNNGTHKIVVVGIEFTGMPSIPIDAALAARYLGA